MARQSAHTDSIEESVNVSATQTNELLNEIKDELGQDLVSPTTSPLEELRMDGLKLDLSAVSSLITGHDFSNLFTLAFETFFGLSNALARLVASGILVSKFPTMTRLKSFFLMQEMTDSALVTLLETFLVSFRGLENLHVLFEGSFHHPIIGPVLDAHRATLKTLIWDHWTAYRSLPSTDVNLQAKFFECMKKIF
jgi:hypothetical protein